MDDDLQTNQKILRELRKKLSRAEIVQHEQDILDTAKKYFGDLEDRDRRELDIRNNASAKPIPLKSQGVFVASSYSLEWGAALVSVAIFLYVMTNANWLVILFYGILCVFLFPFGLRVLNRES